MPLDTVSSHEPMGAWVILFLFVTVSLYMLVEFIRKD